MTIPPGVAIAVADVAIKSIADIINAETNAERDIAISKYKYAYKQFAKSVDAEIKAKQIDAIKDIILEMKNFTYAVFTKKLEFLQNSKDKIIELYTARIQHLEEEKKTYEAKLFSNDPNMPPALCEKRISKIEHDIQDLNHLYSSNIGEINLIVERLHASVPLLDDIKKSMKLLEK